MTAAPFPRLRRTLCHLLLAALPLHAAHAQNSAPAASVVSASPAAGDTVSLNFANAEITSVIEAIGKISGKNFLIDPRVKGTLNIVTNTPVSRDLSYQILLSALRLQGFTAIEGKGVTKIVPEADAKLHGVPVGKRFTGGDRLATQVFPLQHESAAQMLNVVRPLVSPNNAVTAFPANNVLVVTDYADNLERIAQIIASVDVAPGDVNVIRLQHAIAADLADTVTRLLNSGMPGGSVPGAQQGAVVSLAGMGSSVQIVPDTNSNSLLVRADHPAQLRSVRQIVAALDQPGAGGNIHVVYLKNAEAVKVAETLNNALTGFNATGSTTTTNPTSAFGNSTANKTTTGTQDGRQATNLTNTAQTTASASGGTSILPGATVQADPVSNALIIVAPESIYRNLRNVIDQLDRRRAQVYIEALIAEISTEHAAEFGIQWQSTNLPTSGGNASHAFGGTNFGTSGQNIISAMANPTSIGHGLNLLVGSGTVRVPINGQMVDIFSLGMLARFLDSDARTNILSTPTIVTLDNEPAKIVVGRNLPFVTGQYTNTGSSTTTVNPFQTIERQDVGLTLEVRPQISEGGTIKLDIYQEASAVLDTTDTTNGPTTSKRSIKSTVLVDDGAIIALGGLVEDSQSAGEERVPLLGDIPVAGQLFRYNTQKRTKTNLVVFLRPVILRDENSYIDLTRTRYSDIRALQQGREIKNPRLQDPNPPQLPLLPPQPATAPEAVTPLPAGVAPATAPAALPPADLELQAPAPVEHLDLRTLPAPKPASAIREEILPKTTPPSASAPSTELTPAAEPRNSEAASVGTVPFAEQYSTLRINRPALGTRP